MSAVQCSAVQNCRCQEVKMIEDADGNVEIRHCAYYYYYYAVASEEINCAVLSNAVGR